MARLHWTIFALAMMASATTADAQISTNARVFEAVIVEGNDRFRDGDILATSGLEPGIEYSESDLIAATEALQLTGEFRRVRIFSDGPVLTIRVEEAPKTSGNLTFGLGFDSDIGAFGAAGLRLDDALGLSATVSADLLFSEEYARAGAGISVPNNWANVGTAHGVRFEYETFNYDNTLFDLSDLRGELFWQFAAGPGAGEFKFLFGEAEVEDIDPLASPILQADSGSESYSGVGASYRVISEKNSPHSWFANFDLEVLGISGDTEVARAEFSAGAEIPIGGNGFSLRTEFSTGRVWGLSGDRPRAIDRFALGGTRLRGFERGTVTVREVCTGCGAGGSDVVTLLGGDRYSLLSAELVVPVFPKNDQLEAFVFADTGSAWSIDTSASPAGALFSDRDFRSSYGIGVSYEIGGGAIEAYWAIDSNGEAFDEEQAFGLASRFEF